MPANTLGLWMAIVMIADTGQILYTIGPYLTRFEAEADVEVQISGEQTFQIVPHIPFEGR